MSENDSQPDDGQEMVEIGEYSTKSDMSVSYQWPLPFKSDEDEVRSLRIVASPVSAAIGIQTFRGEFVFLHLNRVTAREIVAALTQIDGSFIE